MLSWLHIGGQEARKRPLTFAFNGGPGSATVWLHRGVLRPKHVVSEQMVM
jgi:carboxypeptidase C (cathepsin A)